MTNKMINEYEPDTVSPPGETLQDVIDSFGMSQAELARRMGRPQKTVNEIINGKAAITPDTAIQLERVLNVPASFWNNREKRYREFLAKNEERKKMTEYITWLTKFPLNEMSKFGWIKKGKNDLSQVNELLQYFSIATPKEWRIFWGDLQSQIEISQSSLANSYSLSAWLRQGELLAQNINCEQFNKSTFINNLSKVKDLVNEKPEVFANYLKEYCMEAGVAIVFVPELKGTGYSGATRWLSNSKVLIQLSSKGRTTKDLCSAFMYLATHIIEHGKSDQFITTDDVSNWCEGRVGIFGKRF